MTELDKARKRRTWSQYKTDKIIELEKELTEARTAELTAYLECCKAVEGERIHYSAIADSGSYNRAIDRAIKSIRSLPRFAELQKSLSSTNLRTK